MSREAMFVLSAATVRTRSHFDSRSIAHVIPSEPVMVQCLTFPSSCRGLQCGTLTILDHSGSVYKTLGRSWQQESERDAAYDYHLP